MIGAVPLNLPPQAGPTRDTAILSRVVAGRFDALTWAAVPSSSGGHAATFYAFADALKMDGYRISVSARVATQIADVLQVGGFGLVLPTAKLCDLLFAARTTTLTPSPQPISSSTAATEEHSSRIDRMLAGAGLASSPATGAVYQTVGKFWILDNDTTPGRKAKDGSQAACNYGWHFAGALFDGKPWEPAVTSGRVVQGRGWWHGVDHVDYSQTLVLVSRHCDVDGKPADVLDVMASAELAPLASAQGVLARTRQPGVPVFTGDVPDVSIPLNAPPDSRCPNVTLPPLANVLRMTAAPTASQQAWASRQLGYPLGTVIRDTVDGVAIVGRLECHPTYGAHPELGTVWHRGVSLYVPASLDGSGKLVALPSPPAGWPRSAG
jgi:hypothetical protein